MSRVLPCIFAAALLLGVGWFALGPRGPRDELPASALSFDGDSDRLERTAFVPTLDTPSPAGKSAVWCASFQLAWDQLKADVVKGPVEITGAKEVCDRLNKADPVADDLPDEGCYAAAGFEEDGIRETIRAEMARRFPHAPPSELPEPAGGVLAYAYLEAEVRFEHPYLTHPKGLLFQESGGEDRLVDTFGVPDTYGRGVTKEMMQQANVLFAEVGKDGYRPAIFAVDLSRNSRPNQVVLARVDRKGTLAETLADVERRTRAFTPGPDNPAGSPFSRSLLVPNMRWKVRHQYHELLGPGKSLKVNGGLQPMSAAEQTVSFRLDARGAGVASSAHIATKSADRRVHFDRPFLLYLKKRGAARPFFVMWVENAELLCGSEP